MRGNNIKDEKIQEIQTTFFGIKMESVVNNKTVYVEASIYNLRGNVLPMTASPQIICT